MSLRHTADHRTVETNQLVEVKIYDSQFSGSPSQLKGTGSGWLSYTHQNLNPRSTVAQPIQKGEVKASVWIRDASQRTFRDQLLRGSEGQFKLELYIDSVLEWTGYVLPDLCEYTEDVPEQLSIVAKDFTLLKKDLFPLEDERETIITTIERCLANLGFGLQTVTSTSWIESNTTSGNDFLRQIYHETKALRDFADPDQQITFEEALDRILRNYGLILKQSGGKFRIDQISAYESATSVLRSTYNNGFVSQATENARQSVSPITIDSTNRGNPGLKRVKNIFDHRTQSQVPELPSEIVATGANEPTFTFQLTPNDDQNVEFNARILAFTDDEPQARQGLGFGEADIQLRVGQYYWNGEDWVEDSDARVTFRLEPSRQGAYQGFASISTAKFPSDASAPITIQFFQARLSLFLTTQTQYAGATLEIDTEGISNSILYQLQQIGDFSEEYTHPVTFFGDGPLVDSPSALRYSTDQDDLTSNSWQRRGESGSRLFHSNLLHEILDANRGYRRIINATIKDYLLAYNVVRHDDTDFFYLGGTFDGYTGSWSVQLFEIDIVDEEEQIVTLITERLGTASGLGGFVSLSIRDLRRILGLVNGVGVITRDYNREETSTLEVDLDAPMRVGFDYWVINVDQLSSRDRRAGIYQVEPTGTEGQIYSGLITVPIDEQIIDAPEGSLIVLAPGQASQGDNIVDERVREGEENILTLQDDLDQLDIDLAQLDVELDQLEADLNTLNTVTLPNLQAELDDVLPITEVKISNDAISAPKLQANSVVAGKIGANAVTANTIAADAVTANAIQAGAVVAGKIGANAVTAVTIGAGEITSIKIGAQQVKAVNIDVADLYATNATIGATLTLGTDGEFTNAGDDFLIDMNGIKVNATGSDSLDTSKAFNVDGSFDGGVRLGSMWGFSGIFAIDSASGANLRLRGQSSTFIGNQLSTGNVVVGGGGVNSHVQDFSVNASRRIILNPNNDEYIRFQLNNNADFKSAVNTPSAIAFPVQDGYIRVDVGGSARYIRLWRTA
jgi:hypothetical protein